MFAIFNKKVTAQYSGAVLTMALLLGGNNVLAASSYSRTKYNVPLNKVWKIKLSKEVDSTTLTQDNIKIVDSFGKELPVSLSLDVDKHYVKVALKNGTYNGIHYSGKYNKDSKYTLVVNKNLMSKSQHNKEPKKLLKEVRMDFKTQGDNPYPGLPIENGIVVVGDNAYSVGYLEKYSNISNEIIENGNYDIVYLSKEYGEKIKQILGDNKSKGNVERSETITYYAPDETKYEYEWSEGASEYRLMLSKAFIDVTPGSSKGVVNLTVKKTQAIDGAKYFKAEHSNVVKPIGSSITFASNYPTEKVTLLSADETPVATALVNTFIPYSGFVNLTMFNNANGNTLGNISNNGCAAIDPNFYVYYINTADKSKLYRKDLTGKMDVPITSDKAQYINVLGNYVYYSDYTDNGKIYRMKKDGTHKQKLCDDLATYITVSGTKIFYSNQSDKGKLYKINTDGTIDGININKDPAGKIHGIPVVKDYGNYDKAYDEAHYINPVGDWVYYSNFSDGHKIYTVNKDGHIRRKVNNEWSDGIQIIGNWAYYCSGSGVISKVRIDGIGGVVPIKGTTRPIDKAYHLNINGNWIFYSNAKDKGKLYKISIDGSGIKKKLCDLVADYINIAGDTIYITSNGKTYTLPLYTDGSIKPTLIGKDQINGDIVDVKDVNVTVSFEDVGKPIGQLEAKYLPGKVAAFMKDDTVQQLTVDWDTKNKTYNGQGAYTYTGTVLGFNKKVKCTVTIPSEMLNATSTVEVYNNGPKNGSAIVRERTFGNSPKDLELKQKLQGAKKVEIGDVLSVYAKPSDKKPMGTIKVDASNANAPLIKGLDLDMYGRSFWITITRKDRAESKPTEVRQYGSVVVSGNIDDYDDEALGVDGRDFTIQGWNDPSSNIEGVPAPSTQLSPRSDRNIYIIPGKNGKLNMEQIGVRAVGRTKSSSWSGSNANDLKTGYDLIVRDSLNNSFKEGDYSVYVVTNYEGVAEEDLNGFGSPLVVGKTASIPKGMKAIEEKVPKAPNLPKIYVRKEAKINISNLKQGEEVYLAPEDSKWIAKDITNNEYKSFDNVFNKPILSGIDVGNTGIPYIENKFQARLIDGNLVPSEIKDGRYRAFILNAVGSSEGKGQIIVDNGKPIVQIDSITKSEIREHRVINGKDKEVITKKILTIQGISLDNEDGNLTTYLTPINADIQDKDKNARPKPNAILQTAGKNFTFEVIKTVEDINNPDTTKINLNKYAIYTVDAAGNISDITRLENNGVKNIYNQSGVNVSMNLTHFGKDVIRTKLQSNTQFVSKDLTRVSGYFGVKVNGVLYGLSNQNLKDLGRTQTIDDFMYALMEAKQLDSDGNIIRTSSKLKEKVSIYKVGNKICIQAPDTTCLNIFDKSKLNANENIISDMIGIHCLDVDAKGSDAETQKYEIKVTGTSNATCNMNVYVAGDVFTIPIQKGDSQNTICERICRKLKENVELFKENSAYIVRNSGNTITLTRRKEGAVAPEITLTTLEY